MYCHISKSKELQMSLSLFRNISLMILKKWKKLQDGYSLRLLHICFMQHICIWWKSVSWIFGGTTDKMHINGVHKRRSDENMSVHFRSFYGATVKMLGNAKCQLRWPSSLNSPSQPPLLEWQIWSVSTFQNQPVCGNISVGRDPPFLRSLLISALPLPQHDTQPKTCWQQTWWCMVINKICSALFYAGHRCLKHGTQSYASSLTWLYVVDFSFCWNCDSLFIFWFRSIGRVLLNGGHCATMHKAESLSERLCQCNPLQLNLPQESYSLFNFTKKAPKRWRSAYMQYACGQQTQMQKYTECKLLWCQRL